MPYNNIRIPVVILLDASGSTKYIERLLNEQIQNLITGLKSHPHADRITLMTAQYDDQYYPLTPLSPLSSIRTNVLDLRDPRGATNTGAAIENVLDGLQAQLSVWDSKRIPYTCPVFLLVTDGPVSPGASPDWDSEQRSAMTKKYKEQYAEAAHRVRIMVSGNELIFGAVGIAHSSMHRADMTELSSLTDYRDCLFNPRVRFNSDLDLGDAIKWIMNAVTRSAAEYVPEYSSYNPYANENQRRHFRSGPDVHQQSARTSGVEIDDIICVFFDLNRSNI